MNCCCSIKKQLNSHYKLQAGTPTLKTRGRPSNQVCIPAKYAGFDMTPFKGLISEANYFTLKSLVSLSDQSDEVFVRTVDLFERVNELILLEENSFKEKGKGISKTYGINILDSLSQCGSVQCLALKKGGTKVYVFSEPEKAVRELMLKKTEPKLVPSTRRKQHAQRMVQLEQTGLSILSVSNERYSVIWRLFGGILDAALPPTSKDHRKLIENVAYKLPGRSGSEEIFITVKTTSKENARIMSAADTRGMLALNTMYSKYIKGLSDSQNFENLYIFDVNAFCKEMAMGTTGSDRAIAVAILRRLRDTVFEVDISKAPEFAELFGYQGRSKVEIQYLTGFDYYAEEVNLLTDESGSQDQVELFGDKEIEAEAIDIEKLYDHSTSRHITKLPRVYWISFYPKIHEALVANRKNHGFIAQEELKREKNGWIIRFVTYCRGALGVSDKKHKKGFIEAHLIEFKNWVYPSQSKMPMTDFHKSVLRFMKSNMVEEKYCEITKEPLTLKALLYGYYIELDYTQETNERLTKERPWSARGGAAKKIYPAVLLYRDVHDPMVGDNSLSNQRTRAKAITEEDHE